MASTLVTKHVKCFSPNWSVGLRGSEGRSGIASFVSRTAQIQSTHHRHHHPHCVTHGWHLEIAIETNNNSNENCKANNKTPNSNDEHCIVVSVCVCVFFLIFSLFFLSFRPECIRKYGKFSIHYSFRRTKAAAYWMRAHILMASLWLYARVIEQSICILFIFVSKHRFRMAGRR